MNSNFTLAVHSLTILALQPDRMSSSEAIAESACVHPVRIRKVLSLLKKHGVGMVHNPQSNMKLASGVAPVPQMLKENLPVGLGTDGAASNHDLSLWEEIDTAAKLHKLFSNDPKVVTAEEAFEMATIRGARALHLEKEIGSIEKGSPLVRCPAL